MDIVPRRRPIGKGCGTAWVATNTGTPRLPGLAPAAHVEKPLSRDQRVHLCIVCRRW
jgi:hypothetical protein